ncbi:MAG TPA: hypothetical protein VEC14_01155 [Reyranellaceae bacterium]|nr:hypothetical protein [Reyranellaceae bacterium]
MSADATAPILGEIPFSDGEGKFYLSADPRRIVLSPASNRADKPAPTPVFFTPAEARLVAHELLRLARFYGTTELEGA